MADPNSAVSTLINQVLTNPDLAHSDVFRQMLQAGLQDLIEAEAKQYVTAGFVELRIAHSAPRATPRRRVRTPPPRKDTAHDGSAHPSRSRPPRRHRRSGCVDPARGPPPPGPHPSGLVPDRCRVGRGHGSVGARSSPISRAPIDWARKHRPATRCWTPPRASCSPTSPASATGSTSPSRRGAPRSSSPSGLCCSRSRAARPPPTGSSPGSSGVPARPRRSARPSARTRSRSWSPAIACSPRAGP